MLDKYGLPGSVTECVFSFKVQGQIKKILHPRLVLGMSEGKGCQGDCAYT